ncbi:MAG: AAA family ATPase [Planctomycetia bacterium]
MSDLDRLLRELSDPAAHPEACWAGVPAAQRRVEVVQTHISVVFLTAHHALKVKKPVALWGLVDYATPQARLHWCEEEVRLNRRLAPGLYLGVRPLVERHGRLVVGEPGAGPALEHGVLMRRFDPAHTLERQVVEGRATPGLLQAVGRRLRAFHAAHPLEAAARATLTPRLHAGVLAQNMRATRGFVPQLWPHALHRLLERRLTAGFLRLRGRIRERLAAGSCVDGHGDLRLEHVLVGEPGAGAEAVAVIDTVEFTTRLRHIDPLSDLAFLVMDLLTRGQPALAEALLDGYGVTPAERPLLWHYAAYRAHVRAKVEATTALEAEVPAAQRERAVERARGFFALALTLARRGQAAPGLVLLRGPSGSGKSVIGNVLGPWLDAEVVRSDVIRKQLFGLAPLDRPDAEARKQVYGPEAGARTYAEVLRRGLAAVAGGRHAVLDATYLLLRARREVEQAAQAAGVPLVLVDIQVPPEVVRERLRQRTARGDDASDADVEVYEAQLRTAEPLAADEGVHALLTTHEEAPSALLLRVAWALEEASTRLGAPGAGPRRA